MLSLNGPRRNPGGNIFLHVTHEMLRADLHQSDILFQLVADGNVKGMHQRLELMCKEAVHQLHDVAGWSLMHYAVFFGHIPMVEYLTHSVGMDINTPCTIRVMGVSDWRPIHLACEMGNADMARYLVRKGACPYLFAQRDKKKWYQNKVQHSLRPKHLITWIRNSTENDMSTPNNVGESHIPIEVTLSGDDRQPPDSESSTSSTPFPDDSEDSDADEETTVSPIERTELLIRTSSTTTAPPAMESNERESENQSDEESDDSASRPSFDDSLSPPVDPTKLRRRPSPSNIKKKRKNAVDWWNSMHLAVCSGNLPTVRLLCEHSMALVNYRQHGSRTTPLMLAAKYKCLSIAGFLLESGADIHFKSLPHNTTCLFKAVKYTNSAVFDLLLTHGANVHACQLDTEDNEYRPGSNRFTILHCVVLYCTPSDVEDAVYIIERIHQLAPDLMEVTCDLGKVKNVTAFGIAMLRFSELPELAHVLIRCHANVNCVFAYSENTKLNLLHYAIKYFLNTSGLKAVTFLLENGVDVNMLDHNGFTPLLLAVTGARTQIVKKLVSKKPDPDVVDSSGTCALMVSVRQRLRSITEEILTHLSPNLEIGITFTDARGNQYSNCTPLHMAVGKADLEVAKLLLNHGANLYATMEALGPDQEPCNLTCLHTAVVMDHVEVCRFLLDKGIQQDAREYGLTPLAFAASWGHKNIAQLLIERGADVNSVGSVSGDPPLTFAVKRNKHEVVKLLLDNGADPNIQNNQGFTALHYALNYNHKQSIQHLFDWHDTQISQNASVDGLNVRAVSKQVDHRNNVTALVLGLEYCDASIIERLLSIGADPNARFMANGTSLTPIFLCAEFDSRLSLEHLMKYGADVNAQSSRNETPLHFALRYRHPAIASRLIQCGARLDIRAKAGNGEQLQAIHVAAQTGQEKVIRMLAKYGSSLNARMVLKGTEMVTPLHVAALNDHTETVIALVELGAEVNCKRSDSFTPILTLVSKSNWQSVYYLLQRGADVNCRCIVSRSKDATCLHIASQVGVVEIVCLLLEYGADPMACMVTGDRTGILPMHLAAESGHLGIVKHFVQEVRVPVNASEDCGLTCLHYAANTGKADLVDYLIQNGASLTIEAAFEDGSRKQMLPIHMAAEKGHESALRALIRHGSPLDAVTTRNNRHNISALYLAVCENRPECVKALVEAGADANAADNIGAAPLHIATQRGYEDIFGMLIMSGRANVNIATVTGVTPLHMVAEKGFVEMAFWLLRLGADVDPLCRIMDIHSKKISHKISPLNQACGFGHVEIVRMLLNHGANPYHCECFEGEMGISAVHCAAIRGRSSAIVELVNTAHVSLDVKDEKGRTPLHWAVKECFYECCETLLQLGADPTLHDEMNCAPIDYAENSSLRNLLTQAMKKWHDISTVKDENPPSLPTVISL